MVTETKTPWVTPRVNDDSRLDNVVKSLHNDLRMNPQLLCLVMYSTFKGLLNSNCILLIHFDTKMNLAELQLPLLSTYCH
jgi:hypothetical protein